MKKNKKEPHKDIQIVSFWNGYLVQQNM
jgi:hypothetical protein